MKWSPVCPHHVVIEGVGICVHHDQEFTHGVVKGGDEPPHDGVEVLKLLLPISHLPHHAAQSSPLETTPSPGRQALTRPFILQQHIQISKEI